MEVQAEMRFRECWELIQSDYNMQFGDGLIKLLGRYLLDAGIFASVNYRIAHYLHHRGLGAAGRLLMKFTARVSMITIFATTEIGPRFAISHGEGSKIGPDVIIGEHCIIHHGVLLGRNFNKWRTDENGVEYDQPRLGNNTHLCPGCFVLGPVNIGDDVIIGPQAIVTEDIPSNSVVTLDRQLVIKQIDPDDPSHQKRFATVLPNTWGEKP
jgi:serine O-acetyltransferase